MDKTFFEKSDRDNSLEKLKLQQNNPMLNGQLESSRNQNNQQKISSFPMPLIYSDFKPLSPKNSKFYESKMTFFAQRDSADNSSNSPALPKLEYFRMTLHRQKERNQNFIKQKQQNNLNLVQTRTGFAKNEKK